MPLASQIELPERYRVTRHIASGGMASVWEAEDLLLGRVVAVKVLAAQYAADPGARARFQREARTAAQVSDQSHVVTIYDIGEHAEDAFIVMEYFAGGTLAARLKAAREAGERIPREIALRWLHEAASGLDVAHAAGIVHRDVKPANLLLDAQGRLAVADFGIARLADDTPMTQTGQVLGTAAYISPEQALGLSATAASDRYALAVVAYELLTGSRPFPGGPATAQALAHAESQPPQASQASPHLPHAIDPVLARGLSKDPAERPATGAELVAALSSALGSEALDDPALRFGALDAAKPTAPPSAAPPMAVAASPDDAASSAAAARADAAARAAGAVPSAAAASADGATRTADAAPWAAAARADAAAPAGDAAPFEAAAQAGRVDAMPRAADRAAVVSGRGAQRAHTIQPRPPRPSARAPGQARPAPAAPRPRRTAAAVVGAAFAAAAAIALVLALSSGGNPQSSADRRHAKQTAQTASKGRRAASEGGRTATTASASPPQDTSPPPAPPPAAPAKPASSAPAKPASSAGGTPSQLNDRGYALLGQERYAEAVTPLQASVDGYRAADERGLSYAFALYNLAVALNHSGNSSAAIPLLRERLGYDNQRAKVMAELRDAQAKAGASSSGDGNGNGNGGAKPGKLKPGDQPG
jgi:serine/threonine-protein kinase